jgi:hypothetical protein
MLPEYITSDEAAFILIEDASDSISWWFKRKDGGFFVIEYCHLDFPNLVGRRYSRESGIKRLKEMLDEEGWKLLEGEIPEEAAACS